MTDRLVADEGWPLASRLTCVSAALSVLLLVACGTAADDDGVDVASDADGGTDTGADTDAVGGDCEGVVGATVVGPEGGALELEDVWLLIPAGALAEDTTVCMLTSDGEVPAATIYSPVLSLGPAGLSFDEPVTVSFPKPDADLPLAVFWSRPAGEPGVMQQLPSYVRDDRIEAFAQHFSVVYLADPNSAQSTIACCTPQDPSLYTDDQCLYAPNACDTSICQLSPGTCPAPANPCCSAIDSADDYLPLGCANILVATECTSGPAGDHCQWNATCGPDVTPPLPCCTVVNPASPPPGSGPCVSQTTYGDCTGLAPYCQWNASAACVVPDPCCVPSDPMNDLPGAGCGAIGPYQLCVHTPQCEWNAGPSCAIPDPPTSCCAPLDPANDASPLPCASLPDRIECEDSAGMNHCFWNDAHPLCPMTGPTTACCLPNNPNNDYTPGGCWSLTDYTDCSAASQCSWNPSACGPPPPPPPCCSPVDPAVDDPVTACDQRLSYGACSASPYCDWSGTASCPVPAPPCCGAIVPAQDDPITACGDRLLHGTCTASSYCEWTSSAACPLPTPPCCAAIDPLADDPTTPCATRTSYASCAISPFCDWAAGPSCPAPPPPSTCCSPLDPAHDLPGAACSFLDYASCHDPLASLYCEWNPGPGCEIPTACCAPINPLNDLPPDGCDSLPDYVECTQSAGVGVCAWSNAPTCDACPFPKCSENLSTTPPGTCAPYTDQASCDAQAPDCTWGCDYLPDVCCPVGATPPSACAALSETSCVASPACTFSSVGVCP